LLYEITISFYIVSDSLFSFGAAFFLSLQKQKQPLINTDSVYNKLIARLLKTVSKFIKNYIRPFLSTRRNIAGIINDKMGQ